MSFNLTGFKNRNQLALTGTIDLPSTAKPAAKLLHLKKFIFSHYIVPLYSEQWSVLNKNKLFLNQTIHQVAFYYKMYKLEEFALFLELLKLLKLLIEQNVVDLVQNESTFLSKNGKKEKNSIVSMVYKTTRIEVCPEYELYHIILGKPNIKEKQIYDQTIIQDIQHLLTKEFMTFDKIQNFVLNKTAKTESQQSCE
jgi:hypothetical protein